MVCSIGMRLLFVLYVVCISCGGGGDDYGIIGDGGYEGDNEGDGSGGNPGDTGSAN